MKYLIAIVLIIVSSFSRGNYQQDTIKIKDTVMPKAVDKTNSKVDSIFEAASRPITLEQFNRGLLSLMQHADTMQAAYFLAQARADSIDEERHKESIKKMNAIEAFYKIQEKYHESERVNEWRDKASHVLFAFTGSFLGMAFFAGVITGIKKRKEVISKSKHETE